MSAPTPKEVRECYEDFRSAWSEIREEAAADMQCISVEGPWTAEDRANRQGSGRPCIHLDQINQYLNQYSGNLRKSKRAVQLTPEGDGANDEDAKKRSAVIMGIEDASNAPSAVYIPAAQSAAERSYGFAVIRTEYRDDSSFDQDIVIKPIANPDTVLLSPHYKQPDASDIPEGFVLELMAKKKFKEKYPDARLTDFEDANMDDSTVSDWLKEKYVQVAEFWRVQHKISKLLLVYTAKGPIVFTEEEWKEAKEKGLKGEVKRERRIETPKVMQYLTNGVEILDEVPWPGSRIPIIACLGPERWTTKGGTAKRELLSMVRFARDPQMLFDYFASGEAEVAKRIPKIPFVGAVGQFETDADAWDECTDVPHTHLQYDAITDPTGQNVLPPPVFQTYVANFQEWEVAKDSSGRSIQSAMGIAALPDAAQRRNQKSGIALERIDDMESLGSYHFVDRFENGFLRNMGWQLNELIKPIMDTERDMPVAKPDGSRDTMQLVGSSSHPLDDNGAYEVQDLDADHLHTGKGKFGLTIDSGPTHASLREEQGEFGDHFLEIMPTLPQPGTPGAKVVAFVIRMRPNLGPIGKLIADVYDPPDPSNLPPEAQAAMQQLQGQLQQLQQENQALHMDRAGRVLEQQTKIQLQQMKDENSKAITQLQNDIKVLVAEISAKSQDENQRQQMYAEFWKENHQAAHEHAMQQDQQAHDASQSAIAAQNASQMAAQQAAQQQPASQV